MDDNKRDAKSLADDLWKMNDLNNIVSGVHLHAYIIIRMHCMCYFTMSALTKIKQNESLAKQNIMQ